MVQIFRRWSMCLSETFSPVTNRKFRKPSMVTELFHSVQARRIASYIMDTYGDKPEFPWKRSPQCNVFRNRSNHRWYAILLQAKGNELGEGIAERNILNVKPYPEEYSSLVEQADIFPGIRVDSKAWISISLDGYYEDDFIKTLIDMSYQKANGKRS